MEGFLGFDLGLEGVEIEEVLEGTSWGCRQPLSTVHPVPPAHLCHTPHCSVPVILSYHNFWLAPLEALSALPYLLGEGTHSCGLTWLLFYLGSTYYYPGLLIDEVSHHVLRAGKCTRISGL